MKTVSYNPSDLEVEIANILENLQTQISDLLKNRKVSSVERNLDMDNPTIYLNILDDDGKVVHLGNSVYLMICYRD